MNRPEAVKEAFGKVDKGNKLVDMKCSPVQKGGEAQSPTKVEREQYPYGLQLRFEQEQVAKMPKLKTFKVGDKVSVTGIGEVIELRMREEQGGKESWTVEIQIKKVDVVKGG